MVKGLATSIPANTITGIEDKEARKYLSRNIKGSTLTEKIASDTSFKFQASY